jgi:hypothetical protein
VSPEDCNLELELVLAKGAKVMVTRNLWQTKGHYNFLQSRSLGLTCSSFLQVL